MDLRVGVADSEAEAVKVLCVMLADDYGDAAKGESYERRHFFGALSKMGEARLFDYGTMLKDSSALGAQLQLAAEAFAPDLIFVVLYEDQVSAEVVKRLASRWPVVNWFCDDQWRLRWSLHRAEDFSAVITTDAYALEAYEAQGTRAILSQWAAEPVDTYSARNPNPIEGRVTFVGMRNTYRQWVVDVLKEQGIEVECWGTGWPNGRASYGQMDHIFSTSAVNLNLPNSRSLDGRYLGASAENQAEALRSMKVRDQVKGRHFEIAAAGGFQLTNYVDFLEDYFIIGDEIACYESIDGLAGKIRWYLGHEARRREIALAGQERVRVEHTWEDRFSAIFAELRRMGLLRQEVTCHS